MHVACMHICIYTRRLLRVLQHVEASWSVSVSVSIPVSMMWKYLAFVESSRDDDMSHMDDSCLIWVWRQHCEQAQWCPRASACCSVLQCGAAWCRALQCARCAHQTWLLGTSNVFPAHVCHMSQSRVWCQHRAWAAARSHEPRPGTAGIC